jgi:hypothetical protein
VNSNASKGHAEPSFLPSHAHLLAPPRHSVKLVCGLQANLPIQQVFGDSLGPVVFVLCLALWTGAGRARMSQEGEGDVKAVQAD